MGANQPKKKPEHYAAATGSLFNVSHIGSMYDDSKPRGIGDIITVALDENTKATKKPMQTCLSQTMRQWSHWPLVVKS